jgi:hypothetical protein
MSETKTVTGTLAGIMEKTGDWRQIHVAVHGKQYPVKMDTKKQELIELARAAGDNVMEWTYTEQDSGNPNPHKPGTNYVNRYFEGVAPVGSGGAETASPATGAPAAAPAPSGQMSKEEWARKDSAIHKMACIKTAADALKHTIPTAPFQSTAASQERTDALNRYSADVIHLALGWHRSVLAERDDPAGEDIPFD